MPATSIPSATAQNPQIPDRKVKANLGTGLPGQKSPQTKLLTNLPAGNHVLKEADLAATETLYVKNCQDLVISVEAMCTKVFVEGCERVQLELKDRVITQTLEVWQCKNVDLKIGTKIQTIQADLCDNLMIQYAKHQDFNRVVWSAIENLSLSFEDAVDHVLQTGSKLMAQRNPKINAETDQFIIRLLPNKLTGKPQLANELIVRLENGFPTTEREARQFDERQEANLKQLAKEILGKDINIGKKKDVGPKVGRNDPCICGSDKKFKKCCGTDVL